MKAKKSRTTSEALNSTGMDLDTFVSHLLDHKWEDCWNDEEENWDVAFTMKVIGPDEWPNTVR